MYMIFTNPSCMCHSVLQLCFAINVHPLHSRSVTMPYAPPQLRVARHRLPTSAEAAYGTQPLKHLTISPCTSPSKPSTTTPLAILLITHWLLRSMMVYNFSHPMDNPTPTCVRVCRQSEVNTCRNMCVCVYSKLAIVMFPNIPTDSALQPCSQSSCERWVVIKQLLHPCLNHSHDMGKIHIFHQLLD